MAVLLYATVKKPSWQSFVVDSFFKKRLKRYAYITATGLLNISNLFITEDMVKLVVVVRHAHQYDFFSSTDLRPSSNSSHKARVC